MAKLLIGAIVGTAIALAGWGLSSAIACISDQTVREAAARSVAATVWLSVVLATWLVTATGEVKSTKLVVLKWAVRILMTCSIIVVMGSELMVRYLRVSAGEVAPVHTAAGCMSGFACVSILYYLSSLARLHGRRIMRWALLLMTILAFISMLDAASFVVEQWSNRVERAAAELAAAGDRNVLEAWLGFGAMVTLVFTFAPALVLWGTLLLRDDKAKCEAHGVDEPMKPHDAGRNDGYGRLAEIYRNRSKGR